jgi:lipopolysaccharide transport system ATP-binding protein
MEKSVIVEDLSKSYDFKKWILKEVSFSLYPGEVLGIIGKQGSGKSTLLKILSRVIAPTSGRAVLNGRVAYILRPGAGIDRKLTGRENIWLYASFNGIGAREILKKLNKIIAFAGIEKLIDIPVSQYPLDSYLRYAFSLALHFDPDIVIIDDIVTIGNKDLQTLFLKHIKDLSQLGTTVLLAYDNLATLKEICDSYLQLEEGKIIDYGKPNEVINHEQKVQIDHRKKKDQFQQVIENQFFKIVSIQTVSSNLEETARFKTSEDIYIKLDLEIFVNSTIVIKIDIFSDVLHVFRSTISHDLVKERTPGCYSFLIRIPSYLLAERQYFGSIILKVKDKSEDRNYIYHKIVNFEVYDLGDALFARGFIKGAVPWVVNPLLEWKIMVE